MIGFWFIGILAFIASMLIQNWLKNTYQTWMKVNNAAGLTGAETARAILQANGLAGVKIQPVKGMLSDHYDPRDKTVSLSEGNYGQASVAGMAVAAHEVGHAIQHARGFAPLAMRTAILPVANIGSRLGPWLVIIGLFLGSFGHTLIEAGIILFAAAVLFQVVTLPVEFDASRRALVQLGKLGLATPQDRGGARKVLTAAAMTYVAAAAASIAYLLYFLLGARR
jgi:Zn-dependent membrane protease YugP